MNAISLLREHEPMRLAELAERAGWAARRSAPTAAAYARSFGRHRSQGTRAFQGDDSSAAASNLATIELLARSDEASARAQIAEEMNLMRRYEIVGRTNEELRALHKDLTRREHHAEARESLCTAELDIETAEPHELLDAAETDTEEAELQWWRAEVRREIRDRKMRGTWK